MKKYNEYQSILDAVWFQSIPSTWRSTKMREVFSERTTKVSDKDYPALSVGKMGVVPQLETAVKTDNGDNRKLIKAGDFAINSRSDRKGSGGVSEYDGSASLIITVLKPHKEINRRFYHYLLRSHYFSEEFYRNGQGLVSDLWTTRWDKMRNIYIPIPPKDEQDQIVRYLDWKVSHINRLIQGYQRQIKLLEERRLTLVDNVVTKGLNPNAEMNDSGVYWLGEIPNNWDVIRAKYLFKKEKREPLENDEVVTCFRDGEVTLRKNRRTTGFTESLQENGYQHVCKGDLVIHVMDAFAGAIGISDSDGKGTPVYHCCTPLRNDVYVPYYMHFLRMMAHVGYIQSLYRGIRERSTNFTFDVFSAQMLAMPSFEEQQEIVAYIEQQTAQINLLKGKIAKQISFLEEYRTRLISDVVTGQIDVRDIEIPDYTFEEDNSLSEETDCIEEVSDDAE